MGDISTEPSMEEILSSIKRIIAEEGDGAATTRARRSGRATTAAPVPAEPVTDEDGILELSEPVPEPAPEPRAAPMPIGAPDVPSRAEPILSESAIEATRGPLEALSRMVVRQPPQAEPVPAAETLEGLVRELLKPVLREWLDANLPQIVERMVAQEIARITGRDG